MIGEYEIGFCFVKVGVEIVDIFELVMLIGKVELFECVLYDV